MPEPATVSATSSAQVHEAAPLSQGERLLDTFLAPSRTFTDVLRSASWWLPFLVMALVSYGYLFTIQRQVGWDTVAANISQHEGRRLEQTTRADREVAQRIQATTIATVKVTLWVFPLIILVVNAAAACLLSGTVNILFNGQATFARVFAVWTYGMLPRALTALISIVSLLLGANHEAFYIRNPVGTNLGYYLRPDSASWLVALGDSLDLLLIWGLILVGLGLGIVARVSRAFGLLTVFGWALILLSARVALAGFWR